MPEISRFFGIVVAIFYSDHPPPHFHVRYGRQRAVMDIETLSILKGDLAPRVLGLVVEWGAQHQAELSRTGIWRGGIRRSTRSRRWSSTMLQDVVEVTVIEGYRLRLKFEDGAEGEVDVRDMVPFRGVFAPLRDPEVFGRVEVDHELGCVRWPNGADLDPDVLYAAATGQATPDLSRSSNRTPAA